MSGKPLLDNIAVVTGASMGLGRQMAIDLRHAGARVIGIARGADELVDITLDVGDAEAVHEAFDQILTQHGRIDVLINNAGIEERRSVLHTTPPDVERTMRVNFGGVVNCCLAAIPSMVRHGSGDIVNVSSAAGRSPVPGTAAYCASKAAIIAFSESMSYELASRGVRVHVLFPGYVPTRLSTKAVETGMTIPPKAVHRTAGQVSRAALRALGTDRFEINVARLETAAPVVRAIAPRLYRRGILRAQPVPPAGR
jgi:short-subunit dehydrogenase